MAEQYSPGLLARAYELQAAEAARQKAAQAAAAQEAAAVREATRDRTAGEFAGDTAAAALQTAVGLGGAGYGLANMATLGVADRVLGLSENFDRTQDIVEGFKSAPLKARKAEMQRRFDEEGVGAGAGYLASTPSVLGDFAVQSAGYLIPGAAAARTAGRIAAAGTAARGGSSLAQAGNAQRAATRAGLVAQGGQTAGYMNIDAINAARDAGRSEGEQQAYGLGAGAVGAVVGPAISKLTGAAQLEARAAQAFGGAAVPAGASGLASRVAVGAGQQAVEEGAQESYEQVVRNIAGGNDLGDQVAQNAAIGAILGSVLGGGMGATGRSVGADEAAKLRTDVERELLRYNMDQRGVLAPSALSDWTGPAGAGDNAAILDAQTAALSSQLPVVGEGTAEEVAAVTGAEQIDVAAAAEAGQLDAELEALARDQDAAQARETTANVDAPLSEQLPQVEELTGARRILAERGATRIPRAQVQEIAPEEIFLGPDNASATDTYKQRAPLAGVRQRFGEDTAAAEAQRRGPDALPLEDVQQYFGAAEAGRQYGKRQQTAAEVEAPAAPVPIDLSVPKTKRDYLRDVRAAVAGTSGQDPKRLSGKAWNELLAGAAAEGIAPTSPDFAAYMGHHADLALRTANEQGTAESSVMAAVYNAYPLTAEQQLDASDRWGGLPATEASEDAIFGARPEPKVADSDIVRPPAGRETLGSMLAALGGISMDYQMDITGDKGKKANKGYRTGNLFQRSGTSIDDAAKAAWEAGYMTDVDYANLGGVPKLTELLQRAYSGEPVFPVGSQAFENQMEAQLLERQQTEAAEGASAPAQQQEQDGETDTTFADHLQSLYVAGTAEELNRTVIGVRSSPAFAEYSYEQKLIMENRIAERWSELDGIDFHLADTVAPKKTTVDARRFDTMVKSAPARLGVEVSGVSTVADLSAVLGRQMPANTKGVYTQEGQLYIVRENHTDVKDVAFTIAHEQGHLGLDKLLGTHLRSATRRMWANSAMRKRIQQKMLDLKLNAEGEAAPAASRSLAAEEVLADMLASGERINKDVWAKLRAGVKEFFAKLFGVSDYIVTNGEVDGLLQSVAQVIKGDVTPEGARTPDMRAWFTDTTNAAKADDKFSKVNADLDATIDAARAELSSQRLPPVADFLKSAGEASATNAKTLWSQVKNGSLKDVLVKNFMHLNQLSAFYDKLFAGRIGALADEKSAMEAAFNKMNARDNELSYEGEKLGKQSVNDFAREWSGFGRRQPSKHRALNTMMQYSTFYKVFPDRAWDKQGSVDYSAAGYTEVDRKAALAKVQQMWSAVGTEGQSIYKRSQAIYESRWNERYDALTKELDRIGKVNKEYGGDTSVVDGKIVKYKADIRLALGKLKEGPYSPLQRNGEHTVVVTDAGTGAVIHFSAYDTKEAAQATSGSLREQYAADNSAGNYNVIVSTRADFDSRLGGTSVGNVESQRRTILADVESMLPAGIDDAARAQVANTVSNALTEAYLAGLPDRAFMKHAKTRKNVDGFDLDAFRAFADYSLRSARDIAGIQFDGRIASALNSVETFAKDITLGKMRPDGTKGVYTGDTALIRTVADAVKRQHAASLDVTENKLVNGLSQAGFMWFMTSPSQMFLNATQTHLVALPRLASQYGGGRAAKEIHKAMAQFAKSKGSLLGTDSVLRKSGEVRDQVMLDVLQQLHDEGPLDLTQAHQVSEYAGGRNAALTPYMSKVVEFASMFMHRSEVFNREVTSAAAVRLELDKRGGSLPAKGSAEYDTLVAEMTKLGTRAIDTTHYNYAQSNKPAVMQGAVGKLVFQFQQYRFHTLAMMARDIRNARLGKAVMDPVNKAMGKDVVALSPLDAEEAREARAALSWLLGMQLAFTGAAGTVLAPFAFGIADAFRDDDDLTDSRTDFINYAGKYMSHGVLAGLVDTQRVSAATLIPYYGEKGYEPVGGKSSDLFEYHLMRNLGPWVGLLGDAVNGGSALMNGDVYKASQGLLPKPFRDAVKSVNETAGGIRDQRGVLYAEPSALSSVTSFLGLRSAERRDVEGVRSSIYRANKISSNARDRYLTKLALAQSEGDMQGMAEVRQEIQAWNSKYPDLAITGQEQRRAIVSRARAQSIASQTGVPMGRLPGPTIDALLGR